MGDPKEFLIPEYKGTCNPGRVNAWRGFPGCADGGHGGPVHETVQCRHYRLDWGEEWDDIYTRLGCFFPDQRPVLKLRRVTSVPQRWM